MNFKLSFDILRYWPALLIPAVFALLIGLGVILATGGGDIDTSSVNAPTRAATVAGSAATPRNVNGSRTATPNVTGTPGTPNPNETPNDNGGASQPSSQSRGIPAGTSGSAPPPAGNAAGANGQPTTGTQATVAPGGTPPPGASPAPTTAAAPAATLAPGAPTPTLVPGAPSATPYGGPRLNVLASTIQVGLMTRAVGGDRINLTILMDPGVDPHTYNAKPSDLAAAENADLVLLNGVGLENPIVGVLNAARNARKEVVSNSVPLLTVTVYGLTYDDPHVWHSIPNQKLMLSEIARFLIEEDPANAEVFRVNAILYRNILDAADAQIRSIISTIPPANRRLVTSHAALGYFATEYGIEQFGTIIPSIDTNAEPSAQQLATLVQRMRENNIKCVFAESSLNPQLARVIAEEAGATLVPGLYADSIGPPGSPGETVYGADIHNANLMAGCMR